MSQSLTVAVAVAECVTRIRAKYIVQPPKLETHDATICRAHCMCSDQSTDQMLVYVSYLS